MAGSAAEAMEAFLNVFVLGRFSLLPLLSILLS